MKPVMPRLANLIAATKEKVKGECCLVEPPLRTYAQYVCGLCTLTLRLMVDKNCHRHCVALNGPWLNATVRYFDEY